MINTFTYLWTTEENGSIFDYTVINLDHISFIQMAKNGFKITFLNNKVLVAMYNEMSILSLPVDADIVFLCEDWKEHNPDFDVMKFKEMKNK